MSKKAIFSLQYIVEGKIVSLREVISAYDYSVYFCY